MIAEFTMDNGGGYVLTALIVLIFTPLVWAMLNEIIGKEWDHMGDPTVYTVSRHVFRRTARKRERQLEFQNPGNQYRVEKSISGISRWRVVRVTQDRW